jgi:glucose-6-phosphate 1-dehydrogenase
VRPYREAGQEGFDAYTTLLLDALEGNRQHFLRFDEVEWAWRVLDPILKAWQSDDSPLPTYPRRQRGSPRSRAHSGQRTAPLARAAGVRKAFGG